LFISIVKKTTKKTTKTTEKNNNKNNMLMLEVAQPATFLKVNFYSIFRKKPPKNRT